jgi:hypothetical protein
MPRPSNILKTAVSVAAVVICASPAFAKGGGHAGGGHPSSSAVKTTAQTSGSKGSKASLKGENSIRHMLGGGRGGRGGYYPPVLQPNGNLVQSNNAFVGQTFSGPAHVEPSQYGRFVQSYSWPAHRSVQTEVTPATTGGEQSGQPDAGN